MNTIPFYQLHLTWQYLRDHTNAAKLANVFHEIKAGEVSVGTNIVFITPQ